MRKKLLFAAITVAGFFLIPALSIELGGRLYLHLRYGVPGKSYGIYMPDDELGATHRPNSYNTGGALNNWGQYAFKFMQDQPAVGTGRAFAPYETSVLTGGSVALCVLGVALLAVRTRRDPPDV